LWGGFLSWYQLQCSPIRCLLVVATALQVALDGIYETVKHGWAEVAFDDD